MKILAKQVNLISKKSVPAICEIVNIKVDFRIFVNASHSVFLKKHQNVNKIKTKTFFENRGHAFVENAMVLTCIKIQRKVGAPESCF